MRDRIKCFKEAQNYSAKRSLTACSEVINDIKWKVEYIKHTVCKINACMWYISVLLCCFCFSRYSQWYKRQKKKKRSSRSVPPWFIHRFKPTDLLQHFVSAASVAPKGRRIHLLSVLDRKQSLPPPHPSGLVTPGHSCSSLMACTAPPQPVQLPTRLSAPFNYSAEN